MEKMTYKLKCRCNKQDTCRILNELLGDCEIEEDGRIVWRCSNYTVIEEDKTWRIKLL